MVLIVQFKKGFCLAVRCWDGVVSVLISSSLQSSDLRAGSRRKVQGARNVGPGSLYLNAGVAAPPQMHSRREEEEM